MFTHRVAPVLALLLMLFAQTAQAFFDPPYTTPPNPMAGDLVSINILAGVCDALSAEPGYPKVTRNGNSIRIVLTGAHFDNSDYCNFPIGTATYPVGMYPAGSYTLQVDFLYSAFPFGPTTMTLGIVPFTVAGTPKPSVSVPTNESLGLLTLTLVVAGLAMWALRTRRPEMLLLVLACAPFGARAQAVSENHTIEILVSSAPGAPTPAQIVSYYNASRRSGPPPLQGLMVENPLTTQYLLPVRAAGYFLAWLQAKPNSARARLEAMLATTYPQGANLALALSALRADPYVIAANEPLPMQPSSVSLTDFRIDQGVVPLSGGQYGRDDLNIDAAWQLAGGTALIAVLDTGLYQNHPALRQFSGTTYVGGNFIPSASMDISLTGRPAPNADNTSVDEARPVDIPAGACTLTGASLPPLLAGHRCVSS